MPKGIPKAGFRRHRLPGTRRQPGVLVAPDAATIALRKKRRTPPPVVRLPEAPTPPNVRRLAPPALTTAPVVGTPPVRKQLSPIEQMTILTTSLTALTQARSALLGMNGTQDLISGTDAGIISTVRAITNLQRRLLGDLLSGVVANAPPRIPNVTLPSRPLTSSAANGEATRVHATQ